MSRALLALVLSAIIMGMTVFAALPFEGSTARLVILWPGMAFRSVIKPFGLAMTIRAMFFLTLFFWWLVAWLALRYTRSRPSAYASHGDMMLACPFCATRFELTWPRYFRSPWGRHACPSCGRISKLRTGRLYWGLYIPILLASPFAIVIFLVSAYGAAVPQKQFDETFAWFIDGAGLTVSLLVALALLVPLDRMFDARIRGLTPLKEAAPTE